LKTIDQMNHEEIIALTQEDIDRLVRLECAENGVQLPGEAPLAPVEPRADCDLQVYKVGDLVFFDQEAAVAVSAVIAKHADKLAKVDYDWRRGRDNYKYAAPASEAAADMATAVSIMKVMTRESYLTMSSQIDRHMKALEEYKVLLTDHEAAVEKSDEIRERIMSVVDGAFRRQRELDDMRRRYDEYLRLAEGDVSIARRFFDKANTPSVWVYERMFEQK